MPFHHGQALNPRAALGHSVASLGVVVAFTNATSVSFAVLFTSYWSIFDIPIPLRANKSLLKLSCSNHYVVSVS